MPQIECKNLSLAYEGVNVVEDLSFQVSRGDYLCIVGENGSGKSTLVKGLLGLKAPSGGEIIYGDGLKRNDIGYLPQQTQVQRDFPASVGEVVLSGLLGRSGFHPFFTKADKREAADSMDRLHILDLKDRCYRDLSGGQQQRVLLARALCAANTLLLLDEPVAGLDPIVTAELYKLIEYLNREDKITIIMVSHDILTATKSATHILHLAANTRFFGTREEYFTSRVGIEYMGGEIL